MRWRPSVFVQAIARAIVWATFLPSAWATVLLASMGHAPPARIIVQMALALGVLVVTRPLLSTERARAEFAPLALRPWFLASAIGALASGVTLARLAGAFAHIPMLARDTAGLATLAVLLSVSGLGVLRMRAWGVMLGAFTALASIPIVAWMHDGLLTLPVLLASAPGALMAALVLVARTRSVVRVRVEPQLRVADDASDVEEEHDHGEHYEPRSTPFRELPRTLVG
jgi:hypothetical protein